MVRNLLTCIDIKTIRLIFVEVAALMRVICCTQNDIIFWEKHSPLLCKRFSEELIGYGFGNYWVSKVLEVVALDIFAKNGWRSNNRFCLWFFPLANFNFISVISFWAEFAVRTWLCAVARRRQLISVSKKKYHLWRCYCYLWSTNLHLIYSLCQYFEAYIFEKLW
jgi:hypothetical protein